MCIESSICSGFGYIALRARRVRSNRIRIIESGELVGLGETALPPGPTLVPRSFDIGSLPDRMAAEWLFRGETRTFARAQAGVVRAMPPVIFRKAI
jgi:hypothetical protein